MVSAAAAPPCAPPPLPVAAPPRKRTVPAQQDVAAGLHGERAGRAAALHSVAAGAGEGAGDDHLLSGQAKGPAGLA